MQRVDQIDNAPREFISVADASALLRRSVRTVHRMIADGQLRATKAHGGLRAPFLISRVDVEAKAAEVSR